MNTPTNAAMRPSAEPCNLFAPDDIVRHVRSGHTYRVLGRCTIEATLADCYMYRSTDGHVWIRPVLEMEDGRFVLLTRELDAAQPAQVWEPAAEVAALRTDMHDELLAEQAKRLQAESALAALRKRIDEAPAYHIPSIKPRTQNGWLEVIQSVKHLSAVRGKRVALVVLD